MRPALALALALLLLTLPARADGPGDDRPQRLAELRGEEERLRALRARLERGEAVPSDVLVTPEQVQALPLLAPGVPVGALPNEDELAFERARVEALRARLAAMRQAAQQAPAAAEVGPAAEPAVAAAEPAAVGSATPAAPAPPPPPADPIRLAEAALQAGELEQALQAYEAAAAAAEARQDPRGLARARYGAARARERLGRLDEALAGYAAVALLPESQPWGQAAAFAGRFIEWRRRLSAPRGAATDPGAPAPTPPTFTPHAAPAAPEEHP